MSAATCHVCPHACHLKPGELGRCGARRGLPGRVVALNAGRCTVLALDPVEKKPFARFYPGKLILSYGSFGCNLCCAFCQNWEIAQAGKPLPNARPLPSAQRSLNARVPQGSIPPHDLTPSRALQTYVAAADGLAISQPLNAVDLVEQARGLSSRGNIGIALTYNEPLICPEFVGEVVERAHAVGLKVALVTNGYVTSRLATQLFGAVDAANIDLKAFTQQAYDQLGAPRGLVTVKHSIETAVAQGCHVEVTTLVVPRFNTSPEEMEEQAAWLASLSPELPLHLTRFHPAFRMQASEPTRPATVELLARVARRYLKYVYA